MGLDAADIQADRAAFNSRLAVLARDVHGPFQPRHGMVVFADATIEPAVADPVELHVPKLRDARQLLQVASSLLQEDESAVMQQFEKPSNPVFQSMEYRSVNCCIPCIGYCGRNFCQANKPVRVCRAVGSFSGFASCEAGIDQVVDPNINTNGCSVPLKLATPFKRRFTPSCNAHDVCYNTCGSGRVSCDLAFAANLLRSCLLFPPAIDQCPYHAGTYAAAVAVAGGGYYEDA